VTRLIHMRHTTEFKAYTRALDFRQREFALMKNVTFFVERKGGEREGEGEKEEQNANAGEGGGEGPQGGEREGGK